MNSVRMIILAIAVAAATGAGFLAHRMASAPPQVVTEIVEAPVAEVASVLVVTRDLRIGDIIDSQIAWQDWPADAVLPGFITRATEPDAREAFRGTAARLPFYAGEPLRREKLIDAGEAYMASILPAGKRAVATEISADTSAGGFILPNDRVDVIMARSSESSVSGYMTETILRNIRVLAIDQTIREDEDGRKVRIGQTATLELTPEQAEIITVAQQMASRLTLALRATVDAGEPGETDAQYLISGVGGSGNVRLIKSGVISETATRK